MSGSRGLSPWLQRGARIALVTCAAFLVGTGLGARSAPDPIETLIGSLPAVDKVGQLLLAGYEGTDPAGAVPVIRELRAGGIVVGDGLDADAVAGLVPILHGLAAESGVLPLLIAVDQEGGPVQRIRGGVTTFDPSWSLGLLSSRAAALELACQRGGAQGRELAALGIHLNLAPVLDVLDNPDNRAIGERSFGRDPATAAALGAAYIEALQAQGVLAAAKHFPGLGSSATDSHLTLPFIGHDRARLERWELVPFRAAISARVAAIMVAHVDYPSLDPQPGRPASLSPPVVTDLLRGELGFRGLVLTDELGRMGAIAERYEPGEAAVQAIGAGADLLIVAAPLEIQRRMVDALLGAIGETISPERLDAAVRSVLRAKQRAGLLGPAQPRAPAAGVACGGSLAGPTR